MLARLLLAITTLLLSHLSYAEAYGALVSAEDKLPTNNPAHNNLMVDPQTLIDAHLPYRQELGLLPYVWSDELAKSAQVWADYLAANNQFKHSDVEYGENLWRGTTGAYSLKDMVDAWGAEKKDFVYGLFPHVTKGGMVGHYTQIVWRYSYQVGCALAEGHGKTYLACHYDPAGNYEGEVPY